MGKEKPCDCGCGLFTKGLSRIGANYRRGHNPNCRKGMPLDGSPQHHEPTTLEEYLDRFHSKYTKGNPNECWNWKFIRKGQRYGTFCIRNMSAKICGKKRETIGAHVFALILKLGRPLKKGMLACHTCDNEACVNPDHLFEGTDKDNSQDMVRKGRSCRGEKQGSSKLTWEIVRRIRTLYNRGDTCRWIAKWVKRKFGVEIGEGNIWVIVTNKSWKE